MKTKITLRKGLSRVGWLLILVLISPLIVISQIAPINPPQGGFNINGVVRVVSTAGDWYQGNTPGATGGYLFPDPNPPACKKWIKEAWDSDQDEIFTEGSKFNGNPSTYKWTNSKPTSKNDIHNGMFFLGICNQTGDRWVTIAGDRLSTKGTSYIDFEFLQAKVTMNSDGSFSTEGLAGGRTVGDFVISMEYSGGGEKPSVHVYFWRQTPKGYEYVEETISANYAFAETNRDGPVNAPEGAFGSDTYKQFSFVEAAVDVTQILNLLNQECAETVIQTIFIKTKASDVPDAALKDFIPPQQVKLVFGSASISYGGPYCNTGTTTPTIDGVTSGTFSYTALNGSPSDGLSLNTTSGEINLATSKPGTYEISFAFNAGGNCNKTVKDTVVIQADPTITLGSIDPFCREASGTKSMSLPYTATTGSPTQYRIDFVNSSITDVGWTNIPTTPITFTVPATLNAGSYSGRLWVKTANGCESDEYSISFTVNASTEFTISGVESTCPGSVQTFTYNGAGTPTFAWSVTGATGESTVNESTFDVTANSSCGSYTVRLDITNATGCNSYNTKVVNVVDVIPPVIDQANAYEWEINAECGASISNTPPSATDNCGLTPVVELKSTSTTTVGCGNSVVKRIWEATDACGNKSTREQVIFFTDNLAPVFTDCPLPPITVASLSEVNNPVLNTDACSGSSVQIIYQDVSAGSNVINRKWTAIDASGNKASCNQVITINPAPIVPADKTVTASSAQAVTTNNKQAATKASVVTANRETQLKAFPNPYTYKVNFTFVPSQAGYAVLDLIDMQGRILATVYKGSVLAGVSKTVSYDNSKGYRIPLIYRLTIGKEVRSGKLMPVSR